MEGRLNGQCSIKFAALIDEQNDSFATVGKGRRAGDKWRRSERQRVWEPFPPARRIRALV